MPHIEVGQSAVNAGNQRGRAANSIRVTGARRYRRCGGRIVNALSPRIGALNLQPSRERTAHAYVHRVISRIRVPCVAGVNRGEIRIELLSDAGWSVEPSSRREGRINDVEVPFHLHKMDTTGTDIPNCPDPTEELALNIEIPLKVVGARRIDVHIRRP